MRFDQKALEDLGKKWLKYLKEEIAKDAAKSTFIPRDPGFLRSFSYAIEPGGVVSLYSTWPWLDIITKGTKDKYRMAWLTQQSGVNVVPLAQRDGSIHFRTAPLTVGEAWIHPKIAKHTFINRAYERALQDQFSEVIGKSLTKTLDKKKKR